MLVADPTAKGRSPLRQGELGLRVPSWAGQQLAGDRERQLCSLVIFFLKHPLLSSKGLCPEEAASVLMGEWGIIV